MHRLAHQIFAQDRSKHRLAVAAARERRAARAFEMQVEPRPLGVEDFAQQERAPVAELWGKPTKLVARIGHRKGGGALGGYSAREFLGGRFQGVRVETQ